MGRVTLFLALFLSSLLIATAQTHVPFVNQSISPSTGGAQRSHATADGSAASISQWTLIGPQPLIGPDGKSMTGTMARSGQVNAVAVDPRNSSGVYLGTSGGGVWKTTDGGQTWTPLTDNQPCLSIQALVLAPTNPGIVYAGTAFSNSQFDEMGAGILKSTDGGATWTQLPGPLPMGPGLVAEVWALAVSPSDGNVVLAMASSASGTAVYRSEDGGNTWSPVIAPNGAGPGQILFDPSNGSNAYATFGGVYKSADGGRTWTSASGTGSNVLPAGSYLGLAIAPSTPQTLFVGSLNSSGTQMFRTADGGQNWTPLPSSPDSQGIQVDPVNPDLIFVTSPPGGLWRSTDGGSTWTYLYAAAAPHLGMAFSTDGSLLYLGGELGAWAATDLTNSSLALTDLNSTLATQLLSGIVVHPTNPGIAFAGAEHNGVDTYSGSLQWDWTACDNGGRDGAFDFINPSNIYTLCEPPYAVLKSTDGGATFAQMTNGIDPSELASGILAMAMDPVNPQRLYFAASHVWQTTDGANTWTAISPGLGPGIYSEELAVSRVDPNTVYLGNSNGVYVTTSALAGTGATWTAAGSGLPYNVVQCTSFEPDCPQLNRLVADPASAATAYAVYASYVSGRIFKTTNRGATWTDVSGNLPNLKVNDIAVDPDVPNTLYIATEQGVYSTADGGNTWNPLGTGLPNVAVTALKLQRPTRILFAATFGRSAWDLQLAMVPSPVALSTTSLTFGNQAPPQTVTLTNSGTAPLTLYSVTAPNGFSQVNTCGIQVASGASCTLTVNFVASTSGSYSGNITLSDDAPGQPQLIAVSGTGTGAAPGAALSPTGLTFGSQLVNTASAAQTVTLTNNGSAALAITSVAASGDFAQTNTCGTSVAAGANCAITATFTPTAGGSRTGTITITDNATGSPHTVTLTGTGEDFSVGPPSGGSSSATVTRGQTATYTLSLAPLGGLSGTVSFTCTGAPSEATCTVSPSNATLGSSATNVTVSVATTAPSMAVPRRLVRPPTARFEVPVGWLALIAILVSAAFALLRPPGKLRPVRLGLAGLLFMAALAAMWMPACGGGGGGSGSTGPPPNPGTPTGSYNLTVTATFTSGATTLTHNLTLTLTVH